MIGLLPWRCLDCRTRFYARRVPLRYIHYAHCPRCGSLQVYRIRRKKLDSGLEARLATLLGARALRCDYCRHNFASWRLLWPSAEAQADEQVNVSATGARK
jgi:hypothetical protein